MRVDSRSFASRWPRTSLAAALASLALLGASPATAQRMTARRDSTSLNTPTIRLLASVQASEVTFSRTPTVRVRLEASTGGDTTRVLARTNLASPVVVGTTYRNVFVAVEILGRLHARCLEARISRSATDRPTTACLASDRSPDSSTTNRPSGPP